MSPQIFPKNFPLKASTCQSPNENRTRSWTEDGGAGLAEIMEITLDNGRPSVLCCYQEDYHRRLDRPEGTWKRVAVPYYQLAPPQRNHRKGTAGSRERSELEVL